MTETLVQKRTLWIASFGTILVMMAYTNAIATLALVVSDLGTESHHVAWILSSMSIGLAAVLLATGAIADGFGRRRVFVWGSVVLTGSSLIAALAQSTLVFVIARVLQGVGGAAIMSCSLALLAHAYVEPSARTRATGLWGASIGAGIGLGPLLAAGLALASGWRASHWALAVLSAAAAFLAQSFVAESRAEKPRRVDAVGTSLLALGLSATLAALTSGRSGWTQPLTLGLFLAALVLLSLFTLSQKVQREPMLDLGLLRRPDFMAASVAAFATGAGVVSAISFLPTVSERGLGASTLQTAVAVLAWSAVSAVSAAFSRRLPTTVTPRVQLAASLVGVGIGQLALAGLTADRTVLGLVPGLLIAGVASGFLNAALAKQAVATVPAGSAAVGSGLNNTARYVGAAVGITVVVLLGARPDRAALLSAWNYALAFTVSASLLGAVFVWNQGEAR